KDENVFDIQQGVAIGIFVKHDRSKVAAVGGTIGACVRHSHLWGVREIYTENASGERELAGGKYQWLWQKDVSTTEWTTLEPQSPFYLFAPQDIDLREEYEGNWIISDVLADHGVAMTTARDHVVLDY